MIASELANELLKNPDCEVQFMFFDEETMSNGIVRGYRSFKNVAVADVGYSSKIIILDGNED